MVRDGFSGTEDEAPSATPTAGETKEHTISSHLFKSFILGPVLSLPILFSLMGMLSLISFGLGPLETWAAGLGPLSSILVVISMVFIIGLIVLIATFAVGRITRFGVGSMWGMSLPKNRTWLWSRGFVMFTLGAIVISSLITLETQLESILEPWSTQFSGSLGDFYVGMITGPFSFVGWFLVGYIGYLVAYRLTFFQEK